MLELIEAKNKTHILSKKLPVDLDNRLYSMIHLIGGMDFRDVIRFANNASFDQVTELQQKVEQFPSTIEEIMPYVGGFHYLRDSKEYNDILEERSFFRSHQSHLINLEFFDVYEKQDGGYIRLKDGTTIPVSKRKKSLLFDLLEKV